MAAPVLLGIDLGTTVLKVCAFQTRSGSLYSARPNKVQVNDSPVKNDVHSSWLYIVLKLVISLNPFQT